MEHPELIFSIQDYNHTPMLSVVGSMETWHGPVVGLAFKSFADAAESDIILDLTRLQFAENDAAVAFLFAIKILQNTVHIHAVANAETARLLKKSKLGSCLSISSNFDKIAESVRPEEKYLTSKWLAQVEEDELPLAA